MAIGETIGARSLALLRQSVAEIAGESPQGWTSENFETIDGKELKELVDKLDRHAAVRPISKLRQEHTDIFCLYRDHLYGRRSRKWLFTRGRATQLDTHYEQWRSFVRENLGLDLNGMLKKDTKDITAEKFTDTLKIKNSV